MAFANSLGKAAVALCFIVGLAGNASADLKAYNAAIAKSDFATAASEAASTWPTLDKARPDIGVIAIEFAWSALLASKPEIARTILSSLPPMPAKSPEPELFRILGAWADLAIKANAQTRKELADALDARLKAPSAEVLSVRASQELFKHEWERDNFAGAARAAAIGEQLVERLGEGLIDTRYNMNRNRLVAEFLEKRSKSSYQALDVLAETMDARLAIETNPKMRDKLIGELARTIAWSNVERNVLEFKGQRLPKEKDECGGKDECWFPTPGDASIPVCDIDLDTAGVRPKYPALAKAKALPGFAIYAFEVGEQGKFKSARVLGSAPHEMFTETVDEILPAWKWKMNPESSPGCRLPAIYVVNFDFEIRR